MVQSRAQERTLHGKEDLMRQHMVLEDKGIEEILHEGPPSPRETEQRAGGALAAVSTRAREVGSPAGAAHLAARFRDARGRGLSGGAQPSWLARG